ncbi:MAG: hypothetical protein HY721_15740 [Planctomycetes bacterium]|nr:hypothetical protein [Planctomycetota bacterium]
MEIALDPHQQRRLQELAREAGKPVAVLAVELLAEAISVHENGKKREGSRALEPSTTFHDACTDIDAVIASQGVKPVIRFDDLLGDFWPQDESADDFTAAVREWRREGAGEAR